VSKMVVQDGFTVFLGLFCSDAYGCGSNGFFVARWKV